MESETKKQFITAAVLASLILGILIVGIYLGLQENELLEQNPVYSFAIIVDTKSGGRGGPSVRYEFVVNGNIYGGYQHYNSHLQSVHIGDTCEVVYAQSNPEISRLLKDENNFLKIRRQKRELNLFPE